MPKGISLHIGVNVVDVNHYGNENRLRGCHNDASAMQKIADKQQFKSNILLDEEATTDNVIPLITEAANTLQAGDMFFITYSGHGGQVADVSGDEGGNDETLCLFNREYRDDEFNSALAHFKSGVRILWISDSCHATNNFKNLEDEADESDAPPPPRTIGLDQSMEVLKKNPDVYEVWLKDGDLSVANAPEIPASLVQLAACKEEQLSGDAFKDDPNPKGVFTTRLLKIWDDGAFSGTYQDLIDEIVQLIPKHWNQTPQMVQSGSMEKGFAKQKPFTI